MIPLAKLNTVAVTSIHPPKITRAARVLSLRGARRVSQSAPASSTSAPGTSHEIWPPNESLNKRAIPVGPQGFEVADDCTACDHAPGLVARDAAEAVVAEDQAELAVVLRTPDIGPVGRRRQLDRGDPPSRRHEERHRRVDEVQKAPAHGCVGEDEVGDPERRQDQEGLEHLRDEAEAHERRPREPANEGWNARWRAPWHRRSPSGAAPAARRDCCSGTSAPLRG